MRVRRLSPDGDMIFGGGQAAFFRDVPDAPAQCVMTRLELQLGEWFLDTTDGTPYQTKILGSRTSSTRDPVIRARILGTQGVTAIPAYASQVNRDTRAYSVQATIDTQYGGISIGIPAVAIAPNIAPRAPTLTPLVTQGGSSLTTQGGGSLQAQR